jgi:hypothetical protein
MTSTSDAASPDGKVTCSPSDDVTIARTSDARSASRDLVPRHFFGAKGFDARPRSAAGDGSGSTGPVFGAVSIGRHFVLLATDQISLMLWLCSGNDSAFTTAFA